MEPMTLECARRWSRRQLTRCGRGCLVTYWLLHLTNSSLLTQPTPLTGRTELGKAGADLFVLKLRQLDSEQLVAERPQRNWAWDDVSLVRGLNNIPTVCVSVDPHQAEQAHRGCVCEADIHSAFSFLSTQMVFRFSASSRICVGIRGTDRVYKNIAVAAWSPWRGDLERPLRGREGGVQALVAKCPVYFSVRE